MAHGLAGGAQAFATVARALQSDGTAQEVVQRIVDLAPQLIERCEHAGITMVVNGKVITPAASGPVPIEVDKIQYEANQGPCLDAMREHAVFVTDDLATETRWPDFAARAAAETGVRSMLSFRLFVDEDTFGSLNLYSAMTAAFDATSAATGGVFAAHAAVALASATDRDRSDRLQGELASSERRGVALTEQAVVATVLQRSMLTVLPTIAGLEMVARYHPAVLNHQVGGDWFDAFELPDGTVALAVGDVSGHDLDAAVQMAQLRNMLRALAFDRGGPPSQILRRLDRIITRLAVTDTATCVYGVLERHGGPLVAADGTSSRWRLSFANAGHPPPLLVNGDEATFLDTDEHVMLGLGTERRRSEAIVELTAGMTLLFFTDGLVERRGSSVDDGLARLQAVAPLYAGLPLDKLCDRLVAELAPLPEDDVCLLALRVPSPAS